MLLRRLLPTVFLLISIPSFAAAPGVYAIVGGTVHRASGPPIENGVVVIRSGLIEAVGANVAVPSDATVIDAKGQHVYPGLFNSQSSVGLPAPPRRRRPGPPGAQPPAPRPEEPRGPLPSPAFVAAQQFSISSDTADPWRAKGVTTLLIASSADIFNGQSAILNLAGDTPQSMLIKTPASMQVSFNTRENFTYPGSLMGVISFVRQTLLDARQNELATTVYARNPSGKERPVPNPDLEALRGVLRRDLPVVFVANDELMIQRVAEITREFNLKWIVSGARDAYRMAEYFSSTGVPVLFSVDFPRAPAEDREDQPLRVIRDRVMSPTGPAELAKRNVRFALVSASASDFQRGIRRTVEKGLDEEAALRAVTLWPAQIFAVDRQIGSLEPGKIANVFVSDKKFFEDEAKVTTLLIDGRRVALPLEEPEEEAGEESPAAGSWNLIVRAPEGEVSLQVTLRMEGEQLRGTFSGDRGSGEVRGGSLEGNSVQFTISAAATPTGEMSDWRFDGTISGNSMQGTVTTTLGTFQFSGSKPE